MCRLSPIAAASSPEAAGALGGLDLLVNNAGYSHHQPLLDITEAD